MEYEDAPPKPFYYDYTPTTMFMSGPLTDVVRRVEATFHVVFVDFLSSDHVKYWYACTAMNNGAFLRFEVTLFGHDDGFMVELRHLSGCSFAFGHFAHDFADALGTTFVGGWKPIPMAPPAFDIPFPESVNEAKLDTCRFVLESIGPNAPWRSVMQGLRRIGAMAADEKQADCFNKDGCGAPLATRAAVIYTVAKGDLETRATALNALAEVLSIPYVCPSVCDAVAPLMSEALHDPNMHVRRDAQRIATFLEVCKLRDAVVA